LISVSDLDEAGGEAVLTSAAPIGFDLPADWPPPPRVMPIGSGQAGLEVCAGSFAEFLYRFWMETRSTRVPLFAPALAAKYRRPGDWQYLPAADPTSTWSIRYACGQSRPGT
jgi:hypothetical protein